MPPKASGAAESEWQKAWREHGETPAPWKAGPITYLPKGWDISDDNGPGATSVTGKRRSAAAAPLKAEDGHGEPSAAKKPKAETIDATATASGSAAATTTAKTTETNADVKKAEEPLKMESLRIPEAAEVLTRCFPREARTRLLEWLERHPNPPKPTKAILAAKRRKELRDGDEVTERDLQCMGLAVVHLLSEWWSKLPLSEQTLANDIVKARKQAESKKRSDNAKATVVDPKPLLGLVFSSCSNSYARENAVRVVGYTKAKVICEYLGWTKEGDYHAFIDVPNLPPLGDPETSGGVQAIPRRVTGSDGEPYIYFVLNKEHFTQVDMTRKLEDSWCEY